MPATLPALARTSTRRPLADLWQRAELTDRLYVAYFVGLGALIVLHRDRVDGWPALLAIHAAGLGLLAALVASARRLPAVHAWYPLLMPLVTFPEVARLNLMLRDTWHDAQLLAIEASLFPEPPTLWLPQVVPPLVAELFQVGYLSYFLLLVIVAGLLRRRGLEAPFRGVMAATVLAYMLCYVVFLVWPTEGPAHTLRHLAGPPVTSGPFHALVLLVQKAGVHGNAFPSAHVAGALPPLVFAWRHAPRLGAVVTLLLLLMGCGAVYDGYHYLSDVVAGIAVGAAAAGAVIAVQGSPAWARRFHLAASGDAVLSPRAD
jgi:membrane-associated phospholipid phosphatase